MSSNLVDQKRFARRRIDTFHRKCMDAARTKQQFDRAFAVNLQHIRLRGIEQNSSLRASIQNMHIAAIICGGRLHYPTCNDVPRVELAIDGAFTNFRYVEFLTTGSASEITIARLQIRVVVRDGQAKIIVVTVHPNQESMDASIPEVDHEFW